MSEPRKTETVYYQPALSKSDFLPKHWLNWFVVGILWIFSFMPLPLSRLFGGVIGILMLLLNSKRRRIVSINLELCFPDVSKNKRRFMLWQHYVISGMGYTDLGVLAWAGKKRLLRIVKIHGVSAYQNLAADKQPIILMAPHFIGINVGGLLLSLFHPMFSMYKTQRSSVVNWLLNKARIRFGTKLVARDQGMRPVIRGLNDRLSFYYLPDEDHGPRHSVFAPFFGIQTATLPSLGKLSQTTNALVVPVFITLSWHGYDMYLEPPLENFPTGDKQSDAARMNEVIEQGIKIAPEQYMWTFKIFRTRPEGEPSLYT